MSGRHSCLAGRGGGGGRWVDGGGVHVPAFLGLPHSKGAWLQAVQYSCSFVCVVVVFQNLS